MKVHRTARLLTDWGRLCTQSLGIHEMVFACTRGRLTLANCFWWGKGEFWRCVSFAAVHRQLLPDELGGVTPARQERLIGTGYGIFKLLSSWIYVCGWDYPKMRNRRERGQGQSFMRPVLESGGWDKEEPPQAFAFVFLDSLQICLKKLKWKAVHVWYFFSSNHHEEHTVSSSNTTS